MSKQCNRNRQNVSSMASMAFLLLLAAIVLAVSLKVGTELAKITQNAAKVNHMTEHIIQTTDQDGVNVIRWAYQPEGNGYIVSRRESANGTSHPIAIIEDRKKLAFWDNETIPGKTYYYSVCAYLTNGLVTAKSYSSQTPVTAKLTVPVVRKMSVLSDRKSVYLDWTAVKGAEAYTVYSRSSGKWEKILTTTKVSCIIPDGAGNRYTVKASGTYKGKVLVSDSESGIQKIVNFKNKKILFEGDSITYGYAGLEEKKYFMQPLESRRMKSSVTYPERVSQILGCQYKVGAVSGSTAGPIWPGHNNNIYTRLLTGRVSYAGYDVVSLAVGTNDYAHDLPLGQLGDTAENKTFYGYMNTIVKLIRLQNRTAKIVFILPTYRNEQDFDFTKSGYYAENRLGYTLSEYCTALKEIAANNKIYVYDSSKYGALTKQNILYATIDGLHPTTRYYAEIGNKIAEFLAANVL